MKHILWVSRHAPTPEQMAQLTRILKDSDIIVARYFDNIVRDTTLVKKYRSGKYDDLVVTLPTEMIGRLCTLGIHPIRAVHEMTGVDPDTNMRQYRFLRFERVKSVKVKTEQFPGEDDD